jgi:hypothetical protein
MPEQCGLVDWLGPGQGSIRSIAGLRCPHVDGGCRPERFIYSGQAPEVPFLGVRGLARGSANQVGHWPRHWSSRSGTNAQAWLAPDSSRPSGQGSQRSPRDGRHIAGDSEDAGHEPNRSFCTPQSRGRIGRVTRAKLRLGSFARYQNRAIPRVLEKDRDALVEQSERPLYFTACWALFQACS